MKITITSTTKMVYLDGVPARVWQGHTEAGVPVHCYVTRIAVDRDEDASELERDLQEHEAPRPEVVDIPFRMVL